MGIFIIRLKGNSTDRTIQESLKPLVPKYWDENQDKQQSVL